MIARMCWLFHKWSKWQDSRMSSTGRVVQRRDCERCGKAQERIIYL